VWIETSSGAHLLTGKKQGNFAKLELSRRLHCLVASVFRPLWRSFPKQSNREFWAKIHGSYYPEQGSHSTPSEPLPPPAQIISANVKADFRERGKERQDKAGRPFQSTGQRQRLRGRSRKKRLRVFLATIAKTSLWQKANRNKCLVTQTIRIALTRCN
jgi:hypothetical protein